MTNYLHCNLRICLFFLAQTSFYTYIWTSMYNMYMHYFRNTKRELNNNLLWSRKCLNMNLHALTQFFISRTRHTYVYIYTYILACICMQMHTQIWTIQLSARRFKKIQKKNSSGFKWLHIICTKLKNIYVYPYTCTHVFYLKTVSNKSRKTPVLNGKWQGQCYVNNHR